MKAKLTRTSDIFDAEAKEVEINTLEELLEISDKEDRSLIVCRDKGVLYVEIYDDWRE